MDSDIQPESTSTKLQREFALAGNGLDGFADAALDATTTRKAETLFEITGAAALGAGIGMLRRLSGIGRPIGLAISSGLTGAAAINLIENGTEVTGAFIDNWTSGEHWETDSAIVRKDVGKFAFDSVVMAAAGGVGASLTRGALTLLGTRMLLSEQPVGLPFTQNAEAAALGDALETKSPIFAALTSDDAFSDSNAYSETAIEFPKANGSSRVSLTEAITRNDFSGTSHWMDQNPAPTIFPNVRGTIDTDLVVVGGGTGSIIAAELANRGFKVALLDAGNIVGENTTLSGMAGIATRYPDEAWTTIASELGRANTQRIMDMGVTGQKWLQDLAARAGAFRPGDSFSISADLAELRNEARFIASIDPNTRLIDQRQLGKSIPKAVEAIAINNEGMIDPVRLARRTLEREQRRPGSQLQVFANSPVQGISVDSGVHLDLPNGRINADRVIFMTGLPSAELTGVNIPLLRKNVYALTASISDLKQPPGAVFDDGTFTFFSPTGKDKILFGGAGTKLEDVLPGDTPISKLQPVLNQFYPGATVENAWTRQIAAAPDRRGAIDTSPLFGPKVLVATAFGGTGFWFTGITPQIVSPLLSGRAHPFPEAFGLNRRVFR